MKTRFILLLAITALAPVLAAEIPSATANATNQFKVIGMSCDGCARGVASELKRVPGVASVEVTFSNRLAIVAYDMNRVSAEKLRKTIVDAGYEAKLIPAQKTKRH